MPENRTLGVLYAVAWGLPGYGMGTIAAYLVYSKKLVCYPKILPVRHSMDKIILSVTAITILIILIFILFV